MRFFWQSDRPVDVADGLTSSLSHVALYLLGAFRLMLFILTVV